MEGKVRRCRLEYMLGSPTWPHVIPNVFLFSPRFFTVLFSLHFQFGVTLEYMLLSVLFSFEFNLTRKPYTNTILLSRWRHSKVRDPQQLKREP